MSKNSQDHFVGGLGLGLVVGTGVAMLVATKRGTQLRQKLAQIITEVKAEMGEGELSGQPSSMASVDQAQLISGNQSPADPSTQPATLRDLLDSFYEAVKTELADMANVPAQELKDSPKKRQKKKGKFKNTKKR